MKTGLSVWWATPADPRRHFSSDELLASQQHHRPLRLVGLLSVIGTGVLLAAASVIASGPLERFGSGSVEPGALDDGGPPSWLTGIGFAEVLTSRSLLIGAAITAVALRLPATVADAWFEYRFRHGTGPDADFQPVPISRLLSTVSLLLVLVWGGIVVLFGAFFWLAAAYTTWPVVIGATVVVALAVVAVGEGAMRSRLAQPVEEPLRQRLVGDLIHGSNVDVPVLVGGSAIDAPLAGDHPNAVSVGFGPYRRIVVTNTLLDQPEPVQRYVLAHELSHLRRRHLPVQSLVTVTTSLGAVGAVALAAESDRFRSATGLNLLDPLHLPGLVLLVLAVAAALEPLSAWVGRIQERTADADALGSVGALAADLTRELHGQGVPDLDPPWWIRLLAHHPTPAERLEFAARYRRTAQRATSQTR